MQEGKKGSLGKKLLYPSKLISRAERLRGRLARKVQALKKKRKK